MPDFFEEGFKAKSLEMEHPIEENKKQVVIIGHLWDNVNEFWITLVASQTNVEENLCIGFGIGIPILSKGVELEILSVCGNGTIRALSSVENRALL